MSDHLPVPRGYIQISRDWNLAINMVGKGLMPSESLPFVAHQLGVNAKYNNGDGVPLFYGREYHDHMVSAPQPLPVSPPDDAFECYA